MAMVYIYTLLVSIGYGVMLNKLSSIKLRHTLLVLGPILFYSLWFYGAWYLKQDYSGGAPFIGVGVYFASCITIGTAYITINILGWLEKRSNKT